MPSLGVPPVPEMFFPRRGELCLVEKVSYKGYSPPKCTCNDILHQIIHTHSYKICISLYECPCHAPFPRVLTDSLTHAIFMHEKYFQNKCFLFLNPLDHLRVLNHWTISENPFIGQPSDRVHWTNLRYNLLDNPPK